MTAAAILTVVADAEGIGPTVYVEFYSDQGELAGQTKIDFVKFGKVEDKRLSAVGYVPKQPIVANGTIHIEAEGGNIVAEYRQAEKAKSYQIATPIAGV